MLFLVLCTLLVGAFAAPQWYPQRYPQQHPYPPPPRYNNPGFGTAGFRSQPYFNENIFDTGRFWADLNKELKEVELMVDDLLKRLPKTFAQAGIEGNEYKITISLSGFEEKDIIVKAREGLLMIQATHKFNEGSQSNYLDVRTLPDNVNVTGSWTYQNGILKIVFPLKENVDVAVSSTESEIQSTENPIQSREELDKNADEKNQDVDVGLKRGDFDTEQRTNEISNQSVEATTYAVDLKDEVEFVPVRF